MNKKIEEMALTIHRILPVGLELAGALAKDLYDEGCRKQSVGEWVRYQHGSGIYCSECRHKRRYRDIHDAFCPNCGAKMKGERDE